ncbi:MAG: ASKHA domain-containing protein [Defluviitaleaceae bacterium]|nr:ASKHA domain-containing protein [Defluviitaleaceae bacterium]MCL2238678.1 ASKHA domain-containing protein [Defluviitaleaceae bacterium]
MKENLLTLLRKAGHPVPSPCGGNGKCGKCAVLIDGNPFLACKTDIRLPMGDTPPEILSHYAWKRPPVCERGEGYGIAVDIGTTTLAFELFDLARGTRLGDFSMANSQRALGFDVITRISHATQGAARRLHTYIIEDIRHGVAHILALAGVDASAVRHMALAGNTTMLHLFHDLPCHSLGVYPFTPVDIGSRLTRLDTLPGCEVLTLPGISTFVGADIVAGILCLGGLDSGETRLLIDLGTNGEMALMRGGKVWVTSTAAGPAFEAANISQGMGSVAGAVSRVAYDGAHFNYTTLGDAPPVGICGTGVVDATAELVRHGLMDETGRLSGAEKRVEIAPGVYFTQQDIREVQLAKSAVRSGLDILLAHAGCTPGEIDRVYLAGGFGHRLRPESADALGLFPPGLTGKIEAVGNTSLGGAALALLSASFATEMEAIIANASELLLSSHPSFNELFMEHMLFPERMEV